MGNCLLIIAGGGADSYSVGGEESKFEVLYSKVYQV